jgi:asparagine N-glycosylation enzyme membrane subunit Stt3
MVQENELIVLVIGEIVLAFALKNRRIIYAAVPSGRFFLWAVFVMLVLGWLFTVTESFFLNNIQNLFEHICYMVSSLALLVWCLRLKRTSRDREME